MFTRSLRSFSISEALPRDRLRLPSGLVRIAGDTGTLAALAAAAAGFAASYAITLAAGGTHTVFPHLFYVPVLILALRCGPMAGVIGGVVAGVLCGPIMPANTETQAAQELSGWITRMGFFVGIGLLSGGIMQTMQQHHRRIERLHQEAVSAFVRTIDAKSPYTARHSERVAHFAVRTARALGLPESDCKDVHWAGLLHDIGKLWVSDSILTKTGALTNSEWEIMKQHPVFSEQFLRDIEEFRPYLAAVRGHHERYDGAGYPDGLAADQIPFEARILAVADAFEAMTSDRPYRPALTYSEALIELEHNAGTQFDPAVVRAFITLFGPDGRETSGSVRSRERLSG